MSALSTKIQILIAGTDTCIFEGDNKSEGPVFTGVEYFNNLPAVKTIPHNDALILKEITVEKDNHIIHERVYDCKGNQISYTSSNGYSEEWEYDKNGRETSYKNSNGISYERKYDKDGNLLAYTNSNGEKREWEYDDKRSVISYKENNCFIFRDDKRREGNK